MEAAEKDYILAFEPKSQTVFANANPIVTTPSGKAFHGRNIRDRINRFGFFDERVNTCQQFAITNFFQILRK